MKKYTYTESKDTRSGFGAGLLEAGKQNENVVAGFMSSGDFNGLTTEDLRNIF